MSVLDPLSHVLAAVVAAAHTGLTSLGADPASGTTWVLCIALVVVLVRVALLPLAVHSVRQLHAAARARPQLTELARRYRNRKDPDSVRAFMKERRRIASAHNMSRLSVLPLLAAAADLVGPLPAGRRCRCRPADRRGERRARGVPGGGHVAWCPAGRAGLSGRRLDAPWRGRGSRRHSGHSCRTSPRGSWSHRTPCSPTSRR